MTFSGLSLLQADVRFGERILIKGNSREAVFRTLNDYQEEHFIVEDPSTWMDLLEPTVQPFLAQNTYVGAILTGSDHDAFARKYEALSQKRPRLSQDELVRARDSLENTYFSPEALKCFDREI